MEEKPTSASGGSAVGYSVEARCQQDCGPVSVGKQLFDNQWRLIDFPQGAGVPNDDPLRVLEKHNLYTYQTAQALRWWFWLRLEFFAA
jgi:hypothetical protein